MSKPTVKEWIAALESGKYRKAMNRLRDKNNGMCCLGVLADLNNPEGWSKIDDDWVWGINEWWSIIIPYEWVSDPENLPKDDSAAAFGTINDNTAGYDTVIEFLETGTVQDENLRKKLFWE